MSDRESITEVVRDYYEGWFDGDAERIGGALHDDLVKRSPAETLAATTKERMLELTAAGEGAQDAGDRRIDIRIDDIHGDIASVTVTTAAYHEYLHLVRTRTGWKIANAIWESL